VASEGSKTQKKQETTMALLPPRLFFITAGNVGSDAPIFGTEWVRCRRNDLLHLKINMANQVTGMHLKKQL
jgi:hypothetical protein